MEILNLCRKSIIESKDGNIDKLQSTKIKWTMLVIEQMFSGQDK